MAESIGYMMVPWRKGGEQEPEWWRSHREWCTSEVKIGTTYRRPGEIPTIFAKEVLKPKKFVIPVKNAPFAEK